MIAIRPGSVYKLFHYGSEEEGQTVAFTEKISEGNYAKGTTNEEVINMLIDRFHALNKKQPAHSNMTIIFLLKGVRQLLGERQKRKAENQSKREQNADNTL